MQRSVAIVGSLSEAREFDPPLRNLESARQAGEALGLELAKRNWDLLVFSSDPAFIEADVVRGYIASGLAKSASIHVRAPIDKAKFAELAAYPSLFDIRYDPTRDWEVSFYRAVSRCDAGILLGGGRSTLVTGIMMLALGIPMVAVASFGGSARRVWEISERERDPGSAAGSIGSQPWSNGSEALLIGDLEEQIEARARRTEERLRSEGKAVRRAAVALFSAALLLTLAVLSIVVAWGWNLAAMGSVAVLLGVPTFAAASGALIRTSLDVGRNWSRAAVLGGCAGAVTGALFVASQLVASPDMFEGALVAGIRRLLFFVLPIGFVAGLTFDAVYVKLRRPDASQVGTVEKILAN